MLIILVMWADASYDCYLPIRFVGSSDHLLSTDDDGEDLDFGSFSVLMRSCCMCCSSFKVEKARSCSFYAW